MDRGDHNSRNPHQRNHCFGDLCQLALLAFALFGWLIYIHQQVSADLSLIFTMKSRKEDSTSSLNKNKTTRSQKSKDPVRGQFITNSTTLASDLPSACHGKERWMNIFLDAGHSLEEIFSVCPFLPHETVVHALYGQEPVIWGQETCSEYRAMLRREGVSTPLPRVAGLQNTGTNALQRWLQTNLEMEENEPRRRYFKVPWGKHTPPVSNVFRNPETPCTLYCQQLNFTGNSTAQPQPVANQWEKEVKGSHTSKVSSVLQIDHVLDNVSAKNAMSPEDLKQYQKKEFTIRQLFHQRMTMLPVDQQKQAILNDKHVLPIVLVRDPLYWIQSMCKHPYEYTMSIKQFPCPHLVEQQNNHRPYPVSRIIYPNTVENLQNETSRITKTKKSNKSFSVQFRQPSLVHLWKVYMESYWNASYPRLILRFEDLLYNPKGVWSAIQQCIHGEEAETNGKQPKVLKTNAGLWNNFLSPAKTGEQQQTNFISALVQNANPQTRYRSFDSIDLEFVQQILPLNLFHRFNYAEPILHKETLLAMAEQL